MVKIGCTELTPGKYDICISIVVVNGEDTEKSQVLTSPIFMGQSQCITS